MLPSVKLNKFYNYFPLILHLGFLSSSKKGCNKAYIGLSLFSGSYTKTFEIKSIATGSTLQFLKTLCQDIASINGSLFPLWLGFIAKIFKFKKKNKNVNFFQYIYKKNKIIYLLIGRGS